MSALYRVCRVAGGACRRPYWVFALALASWWLWLAFHTCNAGEPDSLENVHAASNIVHGLGYVSNIVQQLGVVVSLPHPETYRQPMIPFLLASGYALIGIGPHTQVILNVLVVLATATALRAAINAAGATRFADVCAVLFLLDHNYEIINAQNNNLLMLIPSLFLLTAVSWQKGRLAESNPGIAAGILGFLTACAFYTKQSFLLSAVPFSIALILRQRALCKSVVSVMAMYCATFVLLSMPYVARDLYLFHAPVYTDSFATCLAQRYPASAFGGRLGYYRAVRFNHPISLPEVVQTIGWKEYIHINYRQITETLHAAVGLEPALIALLLISCCLTYVSCADQFLWLLLCAEPLIVCALLWHMEQRYLWPIIPVIIFCTATNLHFSYLMSHPLPRHVRFRFGFACLLVIGLAFCGAAVRTVQGAAEDYQVAVKQKPKWTTLISTLPKSATILTEDPWSVTCYTGRPSVIAPLGEREALTRVLRAYKPQYYLWTLRNGTTPKAAGFIRADLEEVSVAPDGTLYRIVYPQLR